MKKFIPIIIGAFFLFAIQLASAQCHLNTWYNGQIVTYCEGNNANDAYYYSMTNSPTYIPYQYPEGYFNNNYSNNYNNSYYPNRNDIYGYNYNSYNNSNNSDYCDYNYCDIGNRTTEENYYNLLYMNNIGGPGEAAAKKPDYFKDNIIGKDKEIGMIDDIKLYNFTYRYASNTAKYTDAKNYIEAMKSKIKEYYLSGKISYNKIYTVINDLDYLVYNLNGQFTNTKIYDTTGNKAYRDVASEYSTEVRTSYDRLKWSLQTYK